MTKHETLQYERTSAGDGENQVKPGSQHQHSCLFVPIMPGFKGCLVLRWASATADDILMSRILDLLFELLDYYKIPGKSQFGILDENLGTIDRLIVESLSSTTESSEPHNPCDSNAATWIKSKS